MSILMYTLRHMKQTSNVLRPVGADITLRSNSSGEQMSERMQEFKKKLRETTPIDDLGVQTPKHPNAELEPLEEWPNGINPHTGEIGGPKGPEPTRYGDWERKGRCYDF